MSPSEGVCSGQKNTWATKKNARIIRAGKNTSKSIPALRKEKGDARRVKKRVRPFFCTCTLLLNVHASQREEECSIVPIPFFKRRTYAFIHNYCRRKPITFLYSRIAYLQMAEKETRKITKQTVKMSPSTGASNSKQSACDFLKNQHSGGEQPVCRDQEKQTYLYL